MDKVKVIKFVRITLVAAMALATGPAMAAFPWSCWPYC